MVCRELTVCWYSVVGSLTCYGLGTLGFEPQWGVSFSVPIQTDPNAHPAFCTVGTSSFLGLKEQGLALITTAIRH